MNKVNRYVMGFIISLIIFFTVLFLVMSLVIKSSVRNALAEAWFLREAENERYVTTVSDVRMIVPEPVAEPVLAPLVDIPVSIPEPIEFDYNVIAISEAAEEPEIEVEEKVEYFDVPLDHGLQDHIFALCEEYGIEPSVVIAMIERESLYDADAVGDNGDSLGLMQIQPKWHEERMYELGCDNLMDPYQNITVGIDILAEMLGYGDLYWALMAYNGGMGYANNCAEAGIITEYADYVVSRSNEIAG